MTFWLGALFLVFFTYGPLPTLYYRRRPKKQELLLTFDDGPDPLVTPKVDGLLRRHQRQGVFFFCGDRMEENKGVVQTVACYHQVGIHGWDHKGAWLLDPYRAVTRWRKMLEVMKEQELSPTYYRGPYGRFNLVDVYYTRKMGLTILFWDGIHRDWMKQEPGALAESLWKKHQRGGVVLLHDGSRGKADSGANVAMVHELDTFLRRLEV